MYLTSFAVFVFGLFVGSFLFNYAERYGSKRSVWRGRSRCPHCKKALEARDLIPVFSYLWHRGRCRRCGNPISIRYPAAEVLTGLLYLLVWLWLGPDLSGLSQVVTLLFYLYLASVAVVLTWIDLRLQLLPNKVLGPATIITGVFLIYDVLEGGLTGRGLGGHLLTGLLAGASFLTLVVVSRGRWMGGGDVKLFALVGLVVGWPALAVATLVSFWSAAAPSVVLLAMGRRKMADRIPFGPFLLLGALVALGFGKPLTDAYLRLIG